MDDYLDYGDGYEFFNNPDKTRARKIYLRNNNNPMNVYSDFEFFRRFRFTKANFFEHIDAHDIPY